MAGGSAIYYGLLTQFFISTPVAVYAVFSLGLDATWWAHFNSYAFSTAMVGLYLYPFVLPGVTFSEAVHNATMNWIVWLSVFTEVVFQIPHNFAVSTLHELKGTFWEWPFSSYGYSDARWCQYNNGTGLEPEVWLINWNDAGLGLLVLVALALHASKVGWTRLWDSPPSTLLVILTLFRDATLWRETVEYMWDHHRKGYPHSTALTAYRPHAIANLWLVNIVWLVAPILTILWSHQHLGRSATKAARKKNN